MGDLNNPTSPRIVATTLLTKWCPLSNWRYSSPMQIHPSGNYIYAAMGLRQPDTVCGDGDGDGVGGDYMQEIYDVSNPYFPRYIRSFPMNAVEQGAVTLNGGSWAWGPNGLAGISSTLTSRIHFSQYKPPKYMIQPKIKMISLEVSWTPDMEMMAFGICMSWTARAELPVNSTSPRPFLAVFPIAASKHIFDLEI